MGFSVMAGLMGGMGKSAEQVLDRNLTRLDAEGVAREKEAAQMRLDELADRRKQEAELRGYKREDFTHARSRDEKVADTAAELAAKEKAEQHAFDLSVNPSRTQATIEHQNDLTTGLMSKQQETKKNESEIKAHNAKAERDLAEAKKTLAEIGAVGAKPLTESEVASRVEVGDKGLRIAYRIGVDPTTGLYTGNAEDVNGYITAKAKLERAVRSGESLPSAYVEKLFSGTETEKSVQKTKEDSNAQIGIDYLNKNKSTFRFKDYTREEFDAMSKEDQDKAINQGKTSATPKAQKINQPAVTVKKEDLPQGAEKIYKGVRYTWDKQAGEYIKDKTQSKPSGLMGETPANPIAQSQATREEDARQTSKIARDAMHDNLIKKTQDNSKRIDSQLDEMSKKNAELKKNIEGGKAMPETQKPTNEKSREEIASTVKALNADAITPGDRIAGMKELLVTPEFIKYYPGLAITYKEQIKEWDDLLATQKARKKGSR